MSLQKREENYSQKKEILTTKLRESQPERNIKK